MKKRKVVRLALINIRKYPGRSGLMFFGILLLLIVSFVVTCYREMLQNKLDVTERAFCSANLVAFDFQEQAPEAKGFARSIPGVVDAQEYQMSVLEMPETISENLDEFQEIPATVCTVKLCIDDEEFYYSAASGVDAYSPIGVKEYLLGGNPYLKYEEEEFLAKTGYTSLLLYGEYPQRAGEMLVTEQFLQCYHIPYEQWEPLVGKHMEVAIHWTKEYRNMLRRVDKEELCDQTEGVVLLKLTICGIVRDLDCVTALNDAAIVGISERIEGATSVFANLDNYTYLDSVKGKMSDRFGVEGRSHQYFDVCKYIGKQIVFSDRVINVFAGIVIVGIVIGLIWITLYCEQQKSGYYGMMKAIGFLPKHIMLISFAESGLLVIVGACTAGVVGAVLAKWLNERVSKAIGVELPLNEGALMFGILAIVLVAIVYFLVSLGVQYRKLICKEAVELLQREV